MTDKKKKAVCLTIAAVLSVLWVAVPILAVAQNVEETERFEDYEILGYDENGNVMLSNDDYEAYINTMLAEMAADDTGTVKKN